ncbi:MAG: hypothetical protein A2W05_04280 [Candidatus Schekmanbacteria bacterium RBG_16_38_10]|uniref:Uncharacterized protein n=1 Tax=Candidatus Schekmanbacteria bacterium RBG_16_38_10 TaxID=1817879 RepID=A0A1F7S0Z4_9BACT|nr:MAG: hypothetical protein A2W05_04280 [Candidatus Schekmanbacteria bacterium RBG_16_38_10]
MAIFLPLALLSGFIMVLILIGTFASATLFHPAIGAEGTDGFDAVSRGFSYIFAKPWHYIWYQLTANVYGVICVVFVFIFAVGMCTLALDAGEKLYPQFKNVNDFALSSVVSEKHSRAHYKWDIESLVTKPHPYGRTMAVAKEIIKPQYVNFNSLRGDHKVAGVIVLAWLLVTLGLAYSYLISYFISSQTIIYFILRKKVDGIEMNEVYEEPEEEEKPSAVTVTSPQGEKKEEGQAAEKKS